MLSKRTDVSLTVMPEPFVSADEAAEFLCVRRRYLLELARRGIVGAYALGTGTKRKIWVFVSQNLLLRLSTEILKSTKCQNCAILHLAVPAEKRTMAYQRGSLKKIRRKEGETWVLRFRVTNAEGKRVENTLPIGLVREFPKDRDAWREVDRIRLGVRINDTPTPGRASFDFLAEHYLKADF